MCEYVQVIGWTGATDMKITSFIDHEGDGRRIDVQVNGVSVVLIQKTSHGFDVWETPYSPASMRGDGGVTMDSFRTKAAAEKWVRGFTSAI